MFKMFEIIAKAFIYSLADLKLGHYIEFIFLEGKLGGFLVISV